MGTKYGTAKNYVLPYNNGLEVTNNNNNILKKTCEDSTTITKSSYEGSECDSEAAPLLDLKSYINNRPVSLNRISNNNKNNAANDGDDHLPLLMETGLYKPSFLHPRKAVPLMNRLTTLFIAWLQSMDVLYNLSILYLFKTEYGFSPAMMALVFAFM